MMMKRRMRMKMRANNIEKKILIIIQILKPKRKQKKNSCGQISLKQEETMLKKNTLSSAEISLEFYLHNFTQKKKRKNIKEVFFS